MLLCVRWWCVILMNIGVVLVFISCVISVVGFVMLKNRLFCLCIVSVLF